MQTILPLTKILYKAKTHTIGGRSHGASRSSDGHLHIRMSTPGLPGNGTNPEQIFAAGWSACFGDALLIVSRKRNLTLTEEVIIDAEVDLCIDNGGYFLQGQLDISIAGIDNELGRELIDEARCVCPYTKAIEGNMQILLNFI